MDLVKAQFGIVEEENIALVNCQIGMILQIPDIIQIAIIVNEERIVAENVNNPKKLH